MPKADIRRETAAGLTTFAAMAYILAVNPAILSDGTGMDKAALVTVTALAAAAGTWLMAGLTKLPVALAPGMGLNALFTYEICGALGVPWEGALGMVFWNGIFFLLLTFTGFQAVVVRAIPECLKVGLQVGIGLFIAFIGMKQSGLLVDHPSTLVDLGSLTDGWYPNSATLTLLGVALAGVLLIRKIPGALLWAMIGVSVAGLFVAGPGGGTLTTRPDAIASLPASPAPVLLKADLLYPFRNWELAWMPVVTLLFVDLFDSIGTLIGVSRRAGLTDASGNLPEMGRALQADAAATTVGALLGTSPVTAYVESAAGVESGGRTGFTGLVVGLGFMASLFLHPLILSIPPAATSAVLMVVGVLMLSGLTSLDWKDLRQTIPAAAVMMFIPFGFGIADGFAIGTILYVVIAVSTGRWRSVHLLLAGLAILFVLKFVLVERS